MRGREEPIRGFDSRLWLMILRRDLFGESAALTSACGDSDHSAAAQKVQGEIKRLLEPASVGEQYHAEGLYKDRSAFICCCSSTGMSARLIIGRLMVRLHPAAPILRGRHAPVGGRNEQWVRFPMVSGFDSRTRLVARKYAAESRMG